METSLHRQLKHIYAGPDAQTEVRLGRYRIDAVCGGLLVEIQHGSLAAIRTKIAALVQRHDVLVVKPIVAKRLLLKRSKPQGPIVDRRQSPKRGRLLDLFDELLYFRQVFPHPRLTLEVPLVEIEEYRYPGHGRRRRWRRDDHVVEDQHLLRVVETHRLCTADDLRQLLPPALPTPFDTAHLAQGLDVPRFVAQKIAYCLRHTGTIVEAGKRGNTRLYAFPETPAAPPAAPRGRRRRRAA